MSDCNSATDLQGPVIPQIVEVMPNEQLAIRCKRIGLDAAESCRSSRRLSSRSTQADHTAASLITAPGILPRLAHSDTSITLL